MRALAIGAIAFGALVAPGAARADVFEIGADGTIAVRAGAAGIAAPDNAETAPDTPAAALTTIDPPSAPGPYARALASAADAARVSPVLLAALVWQESHWRPDAVSAKGAKGLTQLMPATARSLAVDPDDAAGNLAGGARYLRAMLDTFDGDLERALAAYNAGPSRVLRTAGMPAIAETRAYVSSIIDRLSTSGPTLSKGAIR